MKTNYKLLVRTKEDGYLYLGSDFKLYFCDHSGDSRHGEPLGPEACEDTASPLNLKSVATALHSTGAFMIKREDGFTTLLAPRVYGKLQELVRVLNINA